MVEQNVPSTLKAFCCGTNNRSIFFRNFFEKHALPEKKSGLNLKPKKKEQHDTHTHRIIIIKKTLKIDRNIYIFFTKSQETASFIRKYILFYLVYIRDDLGNFMTPVKEINKGIHHVSRVGRYSIACVRNKSGSSTSLILAITAKHKSTKKKRHNNYILAIL